MYRYGIIIIERMGENTMNQEVVNAINVINEEIEELNKRKALLQKIDLILSELTEESKNAMEKMISVIDESLDEL